MKKMTRMLSAMAFVLVALCSCSQDLPESGQGELYLTLDATRHFPKTRAVNETVYKNTDNYTVVVSDVNGVEKMNCKGSEVASKMPLVFPIGGSYTVEAFYGEQYKNTAASRDGFYVSGKEVVSIDSDQPKRVEVVCTPTCGRIAVNFNTEMAKYFSDYKVEFAGTEKLGSNSISWLKDDMAPWYVLLNEAGEEINFSITTTTKEEYIHADKEAVAVRTGKFKLERNKAYRINVNVKYTETETGGLGIDITIDESTNDIPVDIQVPFEWI